ncbi:MAG: SprT-like domain-containing protein [Lachnospiraceae bacterium]|nr:SprT-like domain-containing protein [Lachnospiraceae bacterium]
MEYSEYILSTAIQEALNAGLPVPVTKIEPHIKYSNALTRLGTCTKDRRTGRYQITISRLILDDSAAMKNTMMHELIHTLPGCMNHGKTFLRYAQIVNHRYGYSVSRTANLSECASAELHKEQIRRANYHFICQCCGTEIFRQRSSNFTRHPERYRCSNCGKSEWIIAD